MVVREQRGGYLCIPQSQHAAISGQLARAWGNEEFPAPKPWPELCLAAERHDDGMDDFDAEPELDPETGLPRGFMRMPLDLWLGCWRRGPGPVAEDSPYAGLLVSMHGVHLLGYRRLSEEDAQGKEEAERFRDEQAELAEELVAESAGDPELEQFLDRRALERNRELIALWDAISLAICMPRLPERFEGVQAFEETVSLELEEVGVKGSGELLISVDPWPFDGSEVPLACQGRQLDGTYEDEATMRAALAVAEPETLAATLLPA